ncbi:MAG: DUF2889 domain-containing protein [Blastocatellia bacterium]|nr:DUF2889 domain-containing protein [Blastocatellia bacterium]
MSLEFSITIPGDGYLRSFAAEIDVLAADEILVRGQMRDHRFAFSHVWRVRTPDYQVIEASASQLNGADSQFDPRLCARYEGIKGIRIGRGFSSRVGAALGNLSGRQEHLFLAVEMARVGQQVYQYSPEFEARFPSAAANETEAAYIAWLKDREYMADLANSCYTYRDESTELFKIREVRCGFGAELFRPKPGDKRVFWRNKSLAIRELRAQDGSRTYSCESAMEDRIHDIKVDFDLSPDGLISNARSHGLRLPYHGICEDAQLRTQGLNGLRITHNFLRQFADLIGGTGGCTHLFDLSLDCLRLFRFSSRESGVG